ncbi:MAG: hypothetical protein K2L38_03550, partial [Dysosmobacter sp.]|nr:hypothetical protein [Dysosmobacter sp.]
SSTSIPFPPLLPASKAMRPDRPKSVKDYTVLWLNQMRSYLADSEKAGDMRRALIACAQLAGGLSLAISLRPL